jgi:hypothetical protein
MFTSFMNQSFQLVLVFVNLQSFVISILAANGIPPCDGSRGPLLRGSSEYIKSQYSLCTTCGAGTAFLSGAPGFIPVVSGVRVVLLDL